MKFIKVLISTILIVDACVTPAYSKSHDSNDMEWPQTSGEGSIFNLHAVETTNSLLAKSPGGGSPVPASGLWNTPDDSVALYIGLDREKRSKPLFLAQVDIAIPAIDRPDSRPNSLPHASLFHEVEPSTKPLPEVSKLVRTDELLREGPDFSSPLIINSITIKDTTPIFYESDPNARRIAHYGSGKPIGPNLARKSAVGHSFKPANSQTSEIFIIGDQPKNNYLWLILIGLYLLITFTRFKMKSR